MTQVPVCDCKKCGQKMPVVLREIEVDDMLVASVYCPGCDSVLNIGSNIEVEYYELEDIDRAINFKLKEDNK
jgi:hypothetical protein